ncbi:MULTISPECIES: hypothetical protein [unclassified Frankia]|uniref:hypothetical protein n=1 Tax=unclassified Frankia TaxID=2632575 RepID=UPI00202464E0
MFLSVQQFVAVLECPVAERLHGAVDQAPSSRQLEEVAGFVIGLGFAGFDPASAVPRVPASSTARPDEETAAVRPGRARSVDGAITG